MSARKIFMIYFPLKHNLERSGSFESNEIMLEDKISRVDWRFDLK